MEIDIYHIVGVNFTWPEETISKEELRKLIETSKEQIKTLDEVGILYTGQLAEDMPVIITRNSYATALDKNLEEC